MEILTDNLFFILGGLDNEMAEIIKVLEKRGLPYWQPQLEWGNIKIDHFSLPGDSRGKHLVFVECRPEWLREGTQSKHLTIIDHHSQLSDQPASLLQVLTLLKLKPTLRQQIIASIDSEFLSRTIAKWPVKKSQILKIWEDGYRKKFDSHQDYQDFKDHCQQLFDQAFETRSGNLLTIEQAPDSRTMLAAMADLTGVECCLISGNLESDHLKPCSYIGKSATVEKLAARNFPRAYWGKYYFGCRAVPQEFLEAVRTVIPAKSG